MSKRELGDGEPIPPLETSNYWRREHIEGAKCESGAAQEVSPPSPEQFYESNEIPGFDKEFAAYPDGWFKFAAAYRKFCGGAPDEE